MRYLLSVPLIALLLVGSTVATSQTLYPLSLGGASLDQGFGIAAIPGVGVVVVGEFRQSVDFDPGESQHILTAHGTRDAFVASYDENGHLRWAFHVGSTGVDSANGVAVDDEGNSYVIGTFRLSADFDPGEGSLILTSNGQTDAFIASYDVDGHLRWAFNIGGPGFDQGLAITNTPFGAICVSGSFRETVDFDPGDGQLLFTSAGSYNIWMGCYEAENGALRWAHATGGHGDFDRGWAVAADESGLYVTGDFSDTAQFDPSGSADPLTARGVNDIFVAAFSPEGDFRWAHRAGSNNDDIGNRGDAIALALSASSQGRAVFVTGDIIGLADFPGGLLLDAGAYRSPFLAAFTSDGALLWAEVFPGGGPGRGTGLSTVDFPEHPLVTMTGYFEGSMTLIPDHGPIASPGGRSAFVAAFRTEDILDLHEVFVMGGPLNDQPYGISATASGDTYVTGSFRDTGDFGGPLTATGVLDAFIAKLRFTLPVVSTEVGPIDLGLPDLHLLGPNPFSAGTAVEVRISRSGHLRVDILDVLGRAIAGVHDGPVTAGQRLRINVPSLASGVYTVRAATDAGTTSLRITSTR